MLEFIKFRIVTFLILSAICGYVLTYGWRDPADIIALIMAVFLSCSGASALNNIYDRDIDAVMSRTKRRVVASGRLSVGCAYLIAISMLVAGLAISALYFGVLSTANLMMGAAMYVVIYTIWLKRRSWLSVVIGGAAGSFVMLAGGSCHGVLSLSTVLFSIVVFVWTPCHFWSYAIAMEDDYKLAGIPMLPCVIGRQKTALIIFYKVILLVLLSCFVILYHQKLTYVAALVVTLPPLLYYSHKLYLTQTDDNALRNHRAAIIYMGVVFLSLFSNY